MQIKAAIRLNIFAAGSGKISVILLRLLQVPVLLAALGVDEYGRWLVMSSIPTWLALANLGFGSVAATEMAMAVAKGDFPRAREVFSTAMALVSVVGLLGAVIILAGTHFIPWEHLLHVSAARHGELSMTVVYLALSVFISFFIDAFYGRFQAARKAHHAAWLISARPWLELGMVVTALQFTSRLDALALATLCSSVVFVMLYQWLSRRALPAVTFARDEVQSARFWPLFKKGLAYQAFPLGNALLFQGNLLIVHYFLGPAAVTLFATARTLCRSVNQSMELINQAVWPELSRLLALGDLAKAARLHRVAVLASIIMALGSFVLLAIFGPTLYGWWTGKAVNMTHQLLLLFLLPIPFNALWFTSSVVHVACNQHENLAVRYIIATLFASSTCAFMAVHWGIEGAAFSTLAADLVLIPFVLKRSLVLTGDSWIGFGSGLKHELKVGSGYIFDYLKIVR